MKMINGKIPVMVSNRSLVQLRELAEKDGCILKHDDETGMLEFVPRNECVRPAEDMAPRVVSIARFQPKHCPK